MSRRSAELVHGQSHMTGLFNIRDSTIVNPLKFAEFHNQSPILTMIFHRPFVNAYLADNE